MDILGLVASLRDLSDQYDLELLGAPDWRFTKEAKYKQFKNVQDPGTVKSLAFGNSYAQLFYTAPIWNQISVQTLTTLWVCSFEGPLSDIAAKCVKI